MPPYSTNISTNDSRSPTTDTFILTQAEGSSSIATSLGIVKEIFEKSDPPVSQVQYIRLLNRIAKDDPVHEKKRIATLLADSAKKMDGSQAELVFWHLKGMRTLPPGDTVRVPMSSDPSEWASTTTLHLDGDTAGSRSG